MGLFYGGIGIVRQGGLQVGWLSSRLHLVVKGELLQFEGLLGRIAASQGLVQSCHHVKRRDGWFLGWFGSRLHPLVKGQLFHVDRFLQSVIAGQRVVHRLNQVHGGLGVLQDVIGVVWQAGPLLERFWGRF